MVLTILVRITKIMLNIKKLKCIMFYYKKYQPDVVNALGSSQSALFGHFINNGMKEGRKACSTFDVNVYRNNYKDLRDAFDKNGVIDFSKYFQHYITNGRNEKERTIVV